MDFSAAYTDNRAAVAAFSASSIASSLKHSRSCSSENMDSDTREDRLPPNKVARSEQYGSFPLTSYGASLIRSNACMLKDSSTTTATTDISLLTDSAKAELLARAAALQSYHLQEATFANLKAGGQATLMNLFGGEPVLTAGNQQQTFTENQLRELQLQALIFKHLMCGVAVPFELVMPIRAAMASRSLAMAGHHPLVGWGNYHLGYGGSTDPEPGRCRRTDGKKWRCSRDVVPDQKYCERHMHRGRHRARKLADSTNNGSVNGLNNNTNTNNTTTNNNNNNTNTNSVTTTTNAATTASMRSFPEPANSIATSASCNRNALTLHLQQQQQQQQQQQNHSLPFQQAKSIYNNNNNVESSPFNLQQQLALQISATGVKDFRYMDGTEHAFLSDSQSLSGITAASAHNSHSLLSGTAFDVGSREPGQPLRHFFDDNWPRGARDPAASPWTDLDDNRSNHRSGSMQLSISTDFGCDRASSPSQGPKLELSPLKLSMSRAEEDDPLGLGLGQLKEAASVGASRQLQSNNASWLPISWDHGSGGPLAEMLQSSSNAATPSAGSAGGGGANGVTEKGATETKSGAAGLNLIDAWESSSRGNSPSIAASPTGVLQINATFGTFSDTSTASSPRSAAAAPQTDPAASKGGAEPSSCN